MKKTIIGMVLFIASVQLSYAQAALPGATKGSPTKQEQEILDLSKAKWKWMSDKNVESLNGLFSEKSVFVHMGGSWGKTQELDVIKGGGIWYKKAEVYSAAVNFIGNTAIVLNDIDLLAVVGGNEVVNPFMVTEVYVKENGKWKMGSLTFSRMLRPVKMSSSSISSSSNEQKQHSLEKIWESDSLTLKGPESALFDAESKSLYVSSMKSGSIVRMDLDGKVIKSDWVTGLNSNKGSALFKGLLYTAETSAIAVIDVATAKIIKRIPVEGAVMLNDLAVDSKGVVYVTDTRTGKVYRVEGDKPVLYLENIEGANGLLPVDSDVYVAGSATFQKAGTNKEITHVSKGFESGLDGIVMVAKNEFILSNYKGMLYYVNADGTNQVLLDSRANGIMANDIAYDSQTRTLYVPSFGTNRIIAYKVK